MANNGYFIWISLRKIKASFDLDMISKGNRRRVCRIHKKTGEATGFSKLTNSKNTNSNNLVPRLLITLKLEANQTLQVMLNERC